MEVVHTFEIKNFMGFKCMEINRCCVSSVTLSSIFYIQLCESISIHWYSIPSYIKILFIRISWKNIFVKILFCPETRGAEPKKSYSYKQGNTVRQRCSSQVIMFNNVYKNIIWTEKLPNKILTINTMELSVGKFIYWNWQTVSTIQFFISITC